MSVKNIKIELNVDEINLILEALGSQPFKQVFELVHNIQRQAREQLDDQVEQANAAE